MKSRQVILTLFFLAIILTFVFTFLFYVNWNYIFLTLEIGGSVIAVSMIVIRIVILIAMTIYLFYRWAQQEISQYLSDTPFLMALFIYLLVFGKVFDLFYNLMYYHYDDISFLLLLKVRFGYIIMNMIPLLLVSADIWLFSLSDRERRILWIIKLNTPRLENDQYRSSFKFKLIISISLIEIFIVMMVSSVFMISNLLTVIAIPTLILVTWLFFKAYKLGRLHGKCNPLILALGFLFYTISQVIRVMAQLFFGRTPFYMFIVEFIDSLIFMIIFYGLINKSYRRDF